MFSADCSKDWKPGLQGAGIENHFHAAVGRDFCREIGIAAAGQEAGFKTFRFTFCERRNDGFQQAVG